LIDEVTKLDIGCNYFETNINQLAYADDMISLVPSWHRTQNQLNTIENVANNVNMSFNTKKTVFMIFNPCSKHKIVCSSFPAFSIADCNLLFVEHFKNLSHIIEKSMSDDSDINRELKCFCESKLTLPSFS
jgi:hypothetical protein